MHSLDFVRTRSGGARRRTLGLGLVLLCTQFLPAQIYGNGSSGALAPTADITLDTTPNGGVFQFTSIFIPYGVTVHLVGANPARLLCTGSVTIAGTLEADGQGSVYDVTHNVFTSGQAGGPGGFAGGPHLQPGFGPGGGRPGTCPYPFIAGGSGSHATPGSVALCWPASPVYGNALPFDLRGGSGGGGRGPVLSLGDTGPAASGGGGVMVILADGAIAVSGAVRARGGDISYFDGSSAQPPIGTGGCGSGGSILLRSLQCIQVSGTVDASGGKWDTIFGSLHHAGDGFVRIDGYTACGAPDLTGSTIRPTPFVAAMPFLGALEPARIGQTYHVRVASAPGDVLGFYYSLGTSVLPVPPFGVLELDPTLILFLGQFVVPSTGDDPLAVIDIAVPAIGSLVGVTLHSQVFNAFGTVTGHARLSNRLVTTIGN